MQQNAMTNFARQRGWMPDWAWYQLNGKSAQENYNEQREQILADFTDTEDLFCLVSEVKIK